MKASSLITVLFAGMIMSVSCVPFNEHELNEVVVSEEIGTRAGGNACSENAKYNVDVKLVSEFMKFKNRDKKQSQIIPLVKDGDTLAFCVQYDSGWEIISGDKRVSPIMVKSEIGICNTNDADIQATLVYLQQLRQSCETEIMPTWAFLSGEKGSAGNKLLTRGGGSDEAYTIGMWRAIDTVYVDEYIQTPHIIQTLWDQDYPWNMFRPLKNGQQCVVGCSVVAAGQILYHYRKHNSMGVEFPITARAVEGCTEYTSEGRPIVMDSYRWDDMATTISDINTDYTALMLAYLAQDVMGVGYDINETPNTNVAGVRNAFEWGNLSYDENDEYHFDQILYSLQIGSPVCVFTDMDESSDSDNHVYIIDRYQISDSYYAINCYWDPDYIVSREEFEAYPYERFLERADDMTEKTFYEARLTQTYWGMNWGYAMPNYDNRFYIARYYSGETIDETGIIDAIDCVFDPFWETPIGITENVRNVFYNFRNSSN